MTSKGLKAFLFFCVRVTLMHKQKWTNKNMVIKEFKN